jgi:transposase
MERGRPKAALSLTRAERDALRRWARATSGSPAQRQRARIVLACARLGTNTAVAAALGLSAQTVGKWRGRFLEARLAGLGDRPRSGAPRKQLPADAEWLVILTLLSTPREASHWTTRSMGDASTMSQSSVSRIWRGFRLRPASDQGVHRRADALALARFEDLAALALDPALRAAVRVHRVRGYKRLDGWLAACDIAVDGRERANVVLCECSAEAESRARDWQTTRPRFGLRIAPPGPFWAPMVVRCLVAGAGEDAPAGLAQIVDHAREAVASGDGFAGGTGPYAWTAAGRKIIRAAAESSC